MTTDSAPYTASRLPDRYIREVRRRLPEDQRADISAELGASIADRVESMRHERPDTSLEDAEYAALVELGDPVRLAGEYSGRVSQLIGPELYPSYVRVLKAVLVTAVPAATFVVALVDALDGRSIGAIVGGAAWMAFTVAVQIAFWVTVAFALVERGNSTDDVRQSLIAEWTPEHLPELPAGQRGSVAELATTVSWLALLGAAIVWQQFRSPIDDGGDRLPLLDPDLWTFWLPLLLVLIAVEIGFEVVKYRTGGWSPRLAVASVVLGGLSTATIVYLATTDRLLNPAALAEMKVDDPSFATTAIVVSALGIWVWDSVDGWRKARSA